MPLLDIQTLRVAFGDRTRQLPAVEDFTLRLDEGAVHGLVGESGSGKSELALELVTRGHRLVADDAPEFTQIAPDVLDGTCPDLLQDMLELRGLGVLNIRQMFGDTAVKRNKYLRLIVHLQPMAQGGGDDAMKRLYGDVGYREVLDVYSAAVVGGRLERMLHHVARAGAEPEA